MDIILIHENIATAYTLLKIKIVHKSASDHKPVVLTMGKLENQGPLPFKYNPIWDSKEDFGKLIKDSWKKSVTGSPQYVWETKLKNLRMHLKNWARENYLQDKARKVELQKKMDNLCKEKENKEESKKDQIQEKEIYMEIYKQNRQQEEESRLKSRCLWLKSGDKNTTFFHNTMKIRRSKNQIEHVQVNGQEIKGVEAVKNTTHKHFKELLSTNDQQAVNEEILYHIKKK